MPIQSFGAPQSFCVDTNLSVVSLGGPDKSLRHSKITAIAASCSPDGLITHHNIFPFFSFTLGKNSKMNQENVSLLNLVLQAFLSAPTLPSLSALFTPNLKHYLLPEARSLLSSNCQPSTEQPR